MKNIFLRLPLIFIPLLLIGCAHTEVLEKVVKIPVPVTCEIQAPAKPSMPYTDAPLTGNLFTDTQKALAEIETRKGYETELESAIKACNSK